ncbi:MAG: EamA family transporter [Elusimicrobia bacterium]|nr:EamA family transporter [Elusimicrobiota bacterium]MBK7546017.1 EamA family transporter [Elusimicrobiota bacterium]MBK7574894.1 EamA family transporter [Elusimicrobiota bacterium]MBK7687456.1 EamA family transporter [Elusimicrobiota bacterium]MBK8423085.1 EamA family transporter [Elusimicrobiota bacterium]
MSAFSLAVISALVWGVSAFFEKWGLRQADPAAGVLARTLGVAVGCVIFALAAPAVVQRFWVMDGRSRWALIVGGVLASVVAQLFFYRALKIGEVGKVAVVGGAWPVVAFLLSAAFLGEPVTRQKIVGIALVVSGAVLLR